MRGDIREDERAFKRSDKYGGDQRAGFEKLRVGWVFGSEKETPLVLLAAKEISRLRLIAEEGPRFTRNLLFET